MNSSARSPRTAATSASYLLVPNYQAGRAIPPRGFKLDYKGRDRRRNPTCRWGTLDFQPELSKIASLKPDAGVHLHAGRHGREPREASTGKGRNLRTISRLLSAFTSR